MNAIKSLHDSFDRSSNPHSSGLADNSSKSTYIPTMKVSASAPKRLSQIIRPSSQQNSKLSFGNAGEIVSYSNPLYESFVQKNNDHSRHL